MKGNGQVEVEGGPVCCGTVMRAARGACLVRGLRGPVWRCLRCGTEVARGGQKELGLTERSL